MAKLWTKDVSKRAFELYGAGMCSHDIATELSAEFDIVFHRQSVEAHLNAKTNVEIEHQRHAKTHSPKDTSTSYRDELEMKRLFRRGFSVTAISEIRGISPEVVTSALGEIANTRTEFDYSKLWVRE